MRSKPGFATSRAGYTGAMEGFWPIFFLAVALKIPVACLLYLVWWALHAEPELEEAPEEGGSICRVSLS